MEEKFFAQLGDISIGGVPKCQGKNFIPLQEHQSYYDYYTIDEKTNLILST